MAAVLVKRSIAGHISAPVPLSFLKSVANCQRLKIFILHLNVCIVRAVGYGCMQLVSDEWKVFLKIHSFYFLVLILL